MNKDISKVTNNPLPLRCLLAGRQGGGWGGGGQNEDLLGPPSPSSPPTEGRGDFGINMSIQLWTP
jgi:hypothetical protein